MGKYPTINPTKNPTVNPTTNPTMNPTINPTKNPTTNSTINPTINPIPGSTDSSDSSDSVSLADDDYDSSNQSVYDAKILFNEGDYNEYKEDEWETQIQRNVVLDVNERSMVNIWLIVGVFLISNTMFFWFYCRNNGRSRSSESSSSNHANVLTFL